MPGTVPQNRFEDFFTEDIYQLLKNHLYNYKVRKQAVEKALENESISMVLEVGSGMSPMITGDPRVVYSDLSLTALSRLKNTLGSGSFVVADSTRLPFKPRVFSHVICSEVLEHIEDDTAAIRAMSSVLKPDGRVIITIPHGKCFFSIDDRFVNHFRRYDLADIQAKLKEGGFTPIVVRKVLGPLEKISMVFVIGCYLLVHRTGKALPGSGSIRPGKVRSFNNLITTVFKKANEGFAVLARADASIMPRRLSMVLLMKCALRKGTEQ